MKLLKSLFFLCIAISLSNCSSDNSSPVIFTLSNANVAGTYNIGSLNVDLRATALTAGIPVLVSTAKNTGDTFQIDFIINTNGNYTAKGQYRVVSVVTPVTGSPVTTNTILDINDSGTYQVSTTNNTISFTSTTDDFLSGTFKVVTFNDNTISLSQESEEVDGPITTALDANISFVRK